MALIPCSLSSVSKSPLGWLVASAVPIVILSVTALSLSPSSFRSSNYTIRLYCASATLEPMSKIVERFNQSDIAGRANITAEIVRVGGSGELAGQIFAEQASPDNLGCDIFVSADSLHSQTNSDQNLAVQTLIVASQHPVIAISANNSSSLANFDSLSSLLNSGQLRLAIGSKSTAIGSLTRRIANSQGLLGQLELRKTTDCENVMTIAQALAVGSVDAAIIWDSTIVQFNSINRNLISQTVYLDPTKKLYGSIVVTQIKSANKASDLFIPYLLQNFGSIKNELSNSGFSSPQDPTSQLLEWVD